MNGIAKRLTYGQVAKNDGNYDASKGVYTVPADGVYLIVADLELTSTEANVTATLTVGDTNGAVAISPTKPITNTSVTLDASLQVQTTKGTIILASLLVKGSQSQIPVMIQGGNIAITPMSSILGPGQPLGLEQSVPQSFTNNVQPSRYKGRDPLSIPLDFHIESNEYVRYNTETHTFTLLQDGIYQIDASTVIEVPRVNKEGSINFALSINGSSSNTPQGVSSSSKPVTITVDPAQNVTKTVAVSTSGYFPANSVFTINLDVNTATTGLIYNVIGGDVTVLKTA